MNKKISKVLSLLLVAFMLLTYTPSFASDYENFDGTKVTLREADSDSEKIEISTLEDLVDLSRRCIVDTDSDRLYVSLKNDISCEGIEFAPIPFFNGIFDGNGHEISGLSCQNIAEPVGLFSIIGDNGLVKDLRVSGNLQPKESCNYIGAIAGENRGTIYNCSFAGVVTGEDYVGGLVGRNELTGTIVKVRVSGAVRGDNMTGGIVGINNGTVIDAVNEALVNTESVENKLDIGNLELTLDLTKLSTQKAAASQDMGGIAGYSSGIIANSENRGDVGFHHQGYNIGGIAGRSLGHIVASKNMGLITGRKDIGGIVGQMEPYIIKSLSPSQLSILNEQLSEMQSLVIQTKADATNAGNAINSRLDSLNGYVSTAEGHASELTKSIIGDRDLDIKKPEIDEDVSLEDKFNETTEEIKDKFNEEKEQYKDNVALIKESELYNSLTDVNTQVELLNKEAKGYSDKIDSDLKAINGKYNAIKDTVYSVKDNKYGISDTSVIDPELVILGAVRQCINEGNVEGDLNAGGIAGVMGEESSLDPEEEISLSIDPETHTEYEYKAVMDKCINKGLVTVKRNYAAGIVARAEVGYILDSENYGTICADGNYVGGIAGSSGISINNCYVKAHLNGNKYVGGIIGIGINKKADETGSLVAYCRALPSIDSATKFYGAISATPDGEFVGNIYTSETLAGLGSYSMSEAAYPVSYRELTSGELPAEFTKLYVTFKSDDSILKKVEVPYGSSVGKDIYPELPVRRGCYSRWSINDLTKVVSDVLVDVEYYDYVASLSSDMTRMSERPIFYVMGDFEDTSVLNVSEHGVTMQPSGANGIEDLFYRREVEEEWVVDIPRDGKEVHELRYLPTDISSKDHEIYVNDDGSFRKIEPEKMGSYLSMNVEGEHLIVAIVSTRPVYYAFAIAVAIVLMLVALVTVIIIMCRKLKKEQLEKEKALANIATEEGLEQSVEKEENKVKHKGLRILLNTIYVCLLILVVIGSVYLAKNPQIVSAKINKILLEKIELDSSTQLDIDLEIVSDELEIEKNAYFWREKSDDNKISCLEMNGTRLYKCNDVLWLENGRGFNVSELVPDYSVLFNDILNSLKDSDLSYKKVDGGTEHVINVNSSAALDIIKDLTGEASAEIESVKNLTIVMFSSSWNIKNITVKGSCYTESGEKIAVNCKIKTVPEGERKDVSVPKTVINAIESKNEVADITPDTLSLIYAVGQFAEQDPAMCDINVNVIGGVASVSSDFVWYRQKEKGEWINTVSKNGISLYYNEKGACTSKGVSLNDSQTEIVNSAMILDELMDIALRNTEIESETKKDTVCSISLDEEDMTSVLQLIAPDIFELEKNINRGELTISITGGEIAKIRLELKGTVKVLLLNKAFEIDVTATPKLPSSSSDSDIPLEVSSVLAGK